MQLIRKADSNNNMAKPPMLVRQYKQIPYLTFPLLEQFEMIRHLFSTRMGGVSEGIYATMNLSYTRGDSKEAVDENFRRLAEVMETTPDRFVCAKQTHTTNIRLVTEEDCGKGVRYPADYDDIDGLITNRPGIVLCTSYADCVPLYFVDTKSKAIGLAHSGWRGTVNRMGEKMLEAMNKSFGTRPEDVVAAIGPSICKDCYEVGEDAAEVFKRNFPKEWEYILTEGKKEGKYQLDLWEANKRILLKAGIAREHLAITDICTCCNSRYLFSHRASQGKRGNLVALLEIKNLETYVRT
ncbi:peptidoglycan editing factor PgeF [Parablautia muri]|uniref:Purine nucleoside phosphorylase n=1 Tax=Parablautia muri TaxID=2320879 RepID=A0A9X5BD35_9FIRM|nr:peptidoglycan editing factor PgeF [Parablautia muri]NBJ91505.1 peptidoglycan editing factor PgeF [Parablautia muri]